MNDRKGLEEGDANSLSSIELYARFLKKISFYGQFLIDDMDFTKELREQFPDRIGFISKLAVTDIIPLSQLWVRYTYISNWTYTSFYTFGNYTFFGKSLGYQKNGYEELALGLDLFSIKRLIISLEGKIYRERAQDMESPFIAEKTGFPIGISQNVNSLLLDIRFIPSINLVTGLRLEYIGIENYLNEEGNSQSFTNAQFYFSINGIAQLIKRNRK